MVWRFPPKRKVEKTAGEWNRELTDDVMDRVIRGQLKSTYQSDFIGCPQGMETHAQTTIIANVLFRDKCRYNLISCQKDTNRRYI